MRVLFAAGKVRGKVELSPGPFTLSTFRAGLVLGLAFKVCGPAGRGAGVPRLL